MWAHWGGGASARSNVATTYRWRTGRNDSKYISVSNISGARRADVPNVEGETGRRRFDERGIAAVEMIVVSVIIALLMAYAVPTFLKSPPRTNDIIAKANLMNALIEAKVVYTNAQSYASDGSPYSTISFAGEAPGFSWRTGSCSGQGTNCISERVVDVRSVGDGQGVVLAAWSSSTDTCWYAVDLESVPSAISGDNEGTAFNDGWNGNGSVTTAGVYFGRSRSGASSCEATSAISAVDASPARWSSSIGSAGLVG